MRIVLLQKKINKKILQTFSQATNATSSIIDHAHSCTPRAPFSRVTTVKCSDCWWAARTPENRKSTQFSKFRTNCNIDTFTTTHTQTHREEHNLKNKMKISTNGKQKSMDVATLASIT